MSRRLQILLSEREYREIQRIARARRMSIAQWVRQALDLARRREPQQSMERKLAAIRAAVKHEFPTADIETMLAEIEGRFEK